MAGSRGRGRRDQPDGPVHYTRLDDSVVSVPCVNILRTSGDLVADYRMLYRREPRRRRMDFAEFTEVDVAIDAGVAVVTLNRPTGATHGTAGWRSSTAGRSTTRTPGQMYGSWYSPAPVGTSASVLMCGDAGHDLGQWGPLRRPSRSLCRRTRTVPGHRRTSAQPHLSADDRHAVRSPRSWCVCRRRVRAGELRGLAFRRARLPDHHVIRQAGPARRIRHRLAPPASDRAPGRDRPALYSAGGGWAMRPYGWAGFSAAMNPPRWSSGRWNLPLTWPGQSRPSRCA